MKYCPNCHEELDDKATICTSCGQKLAQPQETSKKSDNNQPESAQQPDNRQGYQQPNYQPNQYQQPNYQQPNYQPNQYQQPNYQPGQYQQPNYQQPNYQQPPQKGSLDSTGMIIWAIINIFVCLPLGIWALVLSVTAKNSPTYEEGKKKLDQSKTINLITTIGGVAITIIEIIMIVILSF